MANMLELEMPTFKEVLEEVGGDEPLLETLLIKFRLWLKQQIHLPQDISDQRLRYFICTTKFDFEKAKKNFDMHYVLRKLIPEIYGNLDPFSDDIILLYKNLQFVTLPNLTPDKSRLSIYRLLETDSSTFDVWISIRYTFMTIETRIEEDIVNSNIFIIDFANLRIGHILKMTPYILKKFECCLNAYGLRIKAIYIINAPNFVEILMAAVKSVMKAKLFSRIQVCTSGIETLDGIIPKSILPVDYGGEQPSLSTLSDMWRTKLAERRNWFLEQEKLVADESLQSNTGIDLNQLFGVPGTFRQLQID